MSKKQIKKGEGGLRADWSVRGFWEHQREALFDCRIFNAGAISYVNTPITTFLETQKNEKNKKQKTNNTTTQLKIEGEPLHHSLLRAMQF